MEQKWLPIWEYRVPEIGAFPFLSILVTSHLFVDWNVKVW